MSTATTKAFDAASAAHLVRDVKRVQGILATGDKKARDAVYDSHFNAGVRKRFFETFDEGYQVSPEVCKELADYRWLEHVPFRWLLSTAMFDDDANFNQARYYLAVARRDQLGLSGDWRDLALAQAKRMLAAGLIDPYYIPTKHLWDRKPAGMFDVLLHAYLPGGMRGWEAELAKWANNPAADLYPERRAALKLIRAKLDAVQAERKRLFHDVWLPALLPANEWAAVQHTPRALLRDLYDNLWEHGYAVYHAAQTETASVHTNGGV